MEHVYSIEIEFSKEEYEGLKNLLEIINNEFYKDNERSLPWLVHRVIGIGLDTMVRVAKEEEERSTVTFDPGEDKL